MSDFRYELQWPRDSLVIDTFAHEIFNYRYHWHRNDYELNILLRGSQEFCRGNENFTLEEDDVLLVSPGVGHASFAQEPNTRALVLHFSVPVLRPYVKKGYALRFPTCRSDLDSRHSEAFRRIRFCAAQVYEAAFQGGPYASLHARAGISMLLSTLCSEFSPQAVPTGGGEEEQQEIIRHLIGYMENHYGEKITLEDLAAFSQYNRTYVSTLFKNTVGVNFYEYLTRLRFQHALVDLVASDKNLTDVALDNGFSDLKSFNKRFKETLGRSPAEYRALVSPDRVIAGLETRRFVSPEDEIVKRKLAEYLHSDSA